MIKDFKEYLSHGIAKKVKPDSERAKSLLQIANKKINFLNKSIDNLGVNDENANEYAEYCYDILMALIRAKMLLDGYNASGLGAHEAEASYARILAFEEKDIQFLDQLRYFRNGILYYGTILDKEYSDKVIIFMRNNYSKLKKYLI
ncbi:hypothetical protein J4462_01705 [Candidatus Pacearchaeota archaeon]|nr:hypothetical protein [Candidatus Pacearchaeota archaeon]